jgi:hypothetical protein
MITNEQITKMLAEIFPAKPVAETIGMTAELQEVIDAAIEAGLEYVPAIIVSEFKNDFTGRVNTYDFSENAVQVNTVLCIGGKVQCTRTVAQMQRTLAHELGHCFHMQHFGASYETHGFAWCEDYADTFADSIGFKRTYIH